MHELMQAEVEDVSGGILFLVVPGWIAYTVIVAEVGAIAAAAVLTE